ncbi:hypothetical protein TWF569_001292 [Orbilia oligospora]|uniref:Uncharacterized protein n=2 Tax=Orbilia oligospora TaxID=2813651 RepID=A0A7C8NDL0_ORBOL|nr:hypothetical protein TWF102_002258 [Orbilia oligospora]KAF3124375.1 hypothetical protein TWF569_001292 [Orbilia oligospora]
MRLIPALMPPRHSQPIPEEFLEGYWSNLDVRVHSCAYDELTVVGKMNQDWLDRGGCSRPSYVIDRLGGFLSLVMPEADPKRLVEMSPLCSFSFLEDDFLDGDMFVDEQAPNLDPKIHDTAILMRKYRNILNQVKSKLFVELLDTDDAQNIYVQAYEEWAKASTETENLIVEFESLEAYLNQRLDNFAASCGWNVMPLMHDFKLTEKNISDLNCIDQLSYRMMILINDFYSVENDWISHAALGKAGLPFSAVYVIMRIKNVSITQAKSIIQEEFLEMERSWVELRDKLMERCDSASAEEFAKYMTCLQYFIGGILVFSMHSPRYHISPTGSSFYPRPEDTIVTLPRRKHQQYINRLKRRRLDGDEENPTSKCHLKDYMRPTAGNGYPSTNGPNDQHHHTPDGNYLSRCVNPVKSFRDDRIPWLSKYQQVSDEAILEPYDYIQSLPSKKIRHAAIDALDIWYNAPPTSIAIIKNIIDMLHSSSLIIDDIEDSSDLRRGQPSTHMVFGTPQSINAANYLFVKCVDEVQKLSFSAMNIFVDELRNLHIGQGSDLRWTFHGECPSEVEYIQMIDGKTGGLFRMASRLMRDQATSNKELQVEGLLTLMGRFFQIRDDYQNVRSVDYAKAKGSLSDLDEGKYSFMIIHALKCNTKNKQLKSLLAMRSQKPLSIEQKELIMKIMEQSKSMEYTFSVLEDLQAEIQKSLEDLESKVPQCQNGDNRNWMIRAIMARLRLADVDLGSLKRQ